MAYVYLAERSGPTLLITYLGGDADYSKRKHPG